MSAGLYTAEDWARFFEIFAEDGGNVTVDADQALKIAAFLRASDVAEEPEGEHVFIERYGVHHAQFGGIGGDVSSLTLTREAWKALGEADVLVVSVAPVEQGTDHTTNHEIRRHDA